MRKSVRYFWMATASIAAICVLLGVLSIAVALGFERERLRSFVEVVLEHSLETEVSVGALEGRLLPGLALRDLRVGPPEAPLIEVARASWRIRGFNFSERRIEIGGLRLAGVRVHLDTRAAAPTSEAAPPATSADARAFAVFIRGVEFKDSEFDWIWSDACAGPCHLRARGRVAARRVALPMSREALAELVAEIAVDFDGALPDPSDAQPLPIAGRVQARLARNELSIDALDLRAGDRDVTLTRTAKIRVEADQLAIERFDIRSGEAGIALRGGVRSDRFENLALTARGVDAGQIAQLAQIDIPLAGRIDADLNLDGALSRPQLRADLSWEDAQIREIRFDRVQAELRAVDPSVELSLRAFRERREIATADAAFPYDGVLNGDFASLPESSARIRSEPFEIAALAPLLPDDLRSLSGMARADLSWRGGPVPSLSGWAELDAARVELPTLGDALAPFRARAAFESVPDGVRVESFSLATAIGRFEGHGVLADAALRDTRVRFEAVDVAAIARRVAAEIEAARAYQLGGELDGEIALAGPLQRPTAQGSAHWSAARINDARAERIAFDFTLDAVRLRGSTRVEQSGRDTLVLRGELPRPAQHDLAELLGAGAEVRALADRFELAPWVALLPDAATSPALHSLSGLARADLLWRGGDAPTLEGGVEIDAARIELPHIGDGLSPFRARADLISVAGGFGARSFSLETPLGRADASGTYAGDTLHDVQLTLDAIDVGGLARTLGVTQEIAGEAHAEFAISGPVVRPDARGSVRWSGPRVSSARAERALLEFDADTAKVLGTLRVQETGRDALLLNAKLPRASDVELASWLGPGAEIDLVGEDFDLATLSPLLPRQLRELRGRADLRLRIEGGAAAPQLDGELSVSDGSLSVPLLGKTFAPIDGRVRLASQQLFPELRIGPPEARAELNGVIDLDGLVPSSGDLELVLSQFQFARSRLLQLDVTGDLRLSGPARAPALLGALRLERAQVRMPEAEDPILREIRIAARPGDSNLVEGATPAPSAIDRATMKVDVRLPRNTWIRGRGIELELEGDLELEKDPLGPLRYAGTVRAVRGRYAFLGKRFDVRSGTATFEGTDKLDPLIDVEAVHRVRDVDILAFLTGRFSNPQLRLSSDPDYEESDVLALLLTGRRADELNERSGSFDAAATKLAVGVAANELSSLLRDHTPIDTLDVRVGERGVPEEVVVGKYVWQDLFVRYGRTFGIESKDKVGIEYQINENWSVESEIVTDQSAGADLIWSIDF